MSQPAPIAPSVVINTANRRQQVPLRDYLNTRVAPFLKKAVTESLGVEAEFPLQWLGECLIHQSILYEGNPDRTNIRERFLYTFEDPKPQEEPTPAPAQPEPVEATQQTDAQERPEVVMNDSTEGAVEAPPAPQELAPQPAPVTEATAVNGVKDDGDATEAQHVPRDGDTEMGGTT
ncbi:uncharacterized protein Z518_09388 [Rhinocladiella mackenziei CBS 650.93]|uniref:Rhinocladiella mackenziei CBS 650.93 unplaced genomic scaffold supercont1.7, whole genome shotgun sequence n=1 Tax=Rhinocladiella mackenziei CBS 650.93 TaxID=1442369 RepID=A0A0D2FI29_9EURO|nr:uncharacterized protein Z518_09388 [Rhinocladiella mackenziei CBS 650.93]KIX01662.1 hypothetical protein Z518_09388 [Rhinocladiella mackenziei CBS 650.93]